MHCFTYYVCSLKAVQVNVQLGLILISSMIYKFERGDKAAEDTENICSAKVWRQSWSQWSNKIVLQEI